MLVKMLWILLNHHLIGLASKTYSCTISQLKFSDTFLYLQNLFRSDYSNMASIKRWIKLCLKQAASCFKEKRIDRMDIDNILLIKH